MEEASYTLRLVIDDLHARLSNNAQNVTTYDHLIGFGVTDPTQSNELEQPLEEFKRHYDQIFDTLNKIRVDVAHIEVQLRSFANEHQGGNDQRARWVQNKGTEITNTFTDTMIRFKLIQQNHLNALRTRHHQLEQHSWSSDANEETKEKQRIIAECVQRVQTDLSDNEYRIDQLRELFQGRVIDERDQIEINFSNNQNNFDDVPLPGGNNNVAGRADDYETASRKQRLWLIIFACLVLMVLILLLIAVLQ